MVNQFLQKGTAKIQPKTFSMNKLLDFLGIEVVTLLRFSWRSVNGEDKKQGNLCGCF